MSTGNVVQAAPPAPPGPVQFDFTRFGANASVTMVDTQALQLNANVTSTNRLKAYGDSGNPLVPAVTAPTVGVSALMAPYADAANTAHYNPTVLLGNTCTYFAGQVFVQHSVSVGQPFNWTPPPFTVLSSPLIRLKGGTLGQTYPLQGGQLRGYYPSFVPQPPLATSGQIYNLNGGFVGGSAGLYR